MDETEWAELLQYLRMQLQQSGLGAVDVDVLGRIRVADDSATRDVALAYLSELELYLRQRSSRPVERTMTRLTQVARAEDGTRIDDLVVVLGRAQQVATGRDEFSLQDLPDLDDTIASLVRLRSELMES